MKANVCSAARFAFGAGVERTCTVEQPATASAASTYVSLDMIPPCRGAVPESCRRHEKMSPAVGCVMIELPLMLLGLDALLVMFLVVARLHWLANELAWS